MKRHPGENCIIETVGLINDRLEINYYTPYEYYFEKIKKLDKKLLVLEDTEKYSFFIPPYCYELYLDTDIVDFSAYALSHLDGNRYRLSYYLELENYYKNLREHNLKLQLFELGDKKIFEREEQIVTFPRDYTEMSGEALAEADGHRYDFQYYMDLHKYYKDMEDYEKKLELYRRGDKEIFNREEKIIPFGREVSSLSAEGLAEMDDYQYDIQYYRDLENYYIELEEYNRKLDLYHGGDKEIFEREEKIIPFGREISNLSAEGIAELDGYRYDFQYYKDLSDYYRKSEEYERKLELFYSGDKDIFNRPEGPWPFGKEHCSLSGEALSELDGHQYEPDYYKDLSNYYEEIQEYERKLELFNAGHKDIFEKEETPPASDKEQVALSAGALADIDGHKYDFQYYIKLENYYKELEEYERKMTLFKADQKDIFTETEDGDTRNIDRVEIEEDKVYEKIWTPSLEDLMAFSRGKIPPYFMDTLFYMLRRVDMEFNEKCETRSLTLSLDSDIKVMDPVEFWALKQEIQKRLVPG